MKQVSYYSNLTKDGRIDRQTDETDRLTDRQAGRQAGRQTDRQTDRQKDRQTGKQINTSKDGIEHTNLKSSEEELAPGHPSATWVTNIEELTSSGLISFFFFAFLLEVDDDLVRVRRLWQTPQMMLQKLDD